MKRSINPRATGASSPISTARTSSSAAPFAAASSGKPKPSPSDIRKFREHVGVLEKKVVELEAKQSEITAALEAPETYADKGKFQHLNRELSAIADQITAATAEWEKATDELAAMEKA